MKRLLLVAALGVLAAYPVDRAHAAPDGTTYTLFESGPTRPLALSPDGKTLAAVNTPDNRVELFTIGAEGRLIARGSVPVGYEPVALAFRGPDELWVVNHVSDSVSVVALDRHALLVGGRPPGHVVRTLLVGDEPYDIVFAGPDRRRAFVTSARRGQNVTPAVLGEVGVDPALTTPGLGRAIVWVFDGDGDPQSMGGVPLTRIELFTDSPRALAVSPDGARVYAAGFRTGNRTASVAAQVRRWMDYQQPIRLGGHVQEAMSHIVRSVDGRWLDFLGHDYTDRINFDLPDEDVFAIDASAPVPHQIEGAVWRGVGTVLYAMAAHPGTGDLYVAHTEARNFAGRETEVRCDFTRNRVSILGIRGRVWPRELNTHLDFADPCRVPLGARDLSLALPTGVAFAPDGATLYVTAMGSDAVAIIDTAALIAGEHRPRRADIVRLTGGGPTGVVRHPARDVLYVATRYDDGISVVSTTHRREIQHLAMHSPEPLDVVRGRRLLYDARATSINGTGACASCHVFGHVDALGWDLGSVHADVLPTIARPSIPSDALGPFTPFFDLANTIYEHQQLKGAMVTQSLRGLDNHGPMHWRGDRYDARVLEGLPTRQPDLGLYDERAAFDAFNGTFDTLHGLPGGIADQDMRAFTDFAMRLTYPPNAIRNLDDSLTPAQARGREFYFDAERPADAIGPCSACHVLDRDGNAEHGVARPGFYGTDGRMTFDALPQMFKVPHLRNVYDKVGMFGTSGMNAFLQDQPQFVDADGADIDAFAHLGAQVRGFGFVHDGTLDGVRRYLSARPFAVGPPDDEERPFVGDVELVGVPREVQRDVEAFVHAYPGNLAPVVGQQITLDDESLTVGASRLLMFVDQHAADNCDLIAHRRLDGESLGYLYIGGGRVIDDRGREDALLYLLGDLDISPLTLTCAAPGDGYRLAIDRDGDGTLDGDERERGTNPADPRSPGRLGHPSAP